MLRADALQHRLPTGSDADDAADLSKLFASAEVICIPSSSCVAMMRDHYPKMAAASGETALEAQRLTTCCRGFSNSPNCWWTSWASRCRGFLSRMRSRCIPPAIRCVRCTWATSRSGCCKQVRGLTLLEFAGSGAMLRFRRDIRDKESGSFGRHAVRQGAVRSGYASGGLHGAGQFLPDAHSAAGSRGSAPEFGRCISPRFWLRPRRSSTVSISVGEAAQAPEFPAAAKKLMEDSQLRHNVRHATR